MSDSEGESRDAPAAGRAKGPGAFGARLPPGGIFDAAAKARKSDDTQKANASTWKAFVSYLQTVRQGVRAVQYRAVQR
jgi:hypothetical protein